MNIENPDPLLWDAKRVAQELGLSTKSVYRLVTDNHIPHTRIGPGNGLIRFDPADVRKWMEAQYVKATTAEQPGPLLWDAKRLAEELDIHLKSVYRLVTEKRIPFVRVGSGGGAIRFRPDEIRKWIAEREVKAV